MIKVFYFHKDKQNTRYLPINLSIIISINALATIAAQPPGRCYSGADEAAVVD